MHHASEFTFAFFFGEPHVCITLGSFTLPFLERLFSSLEVYDFFFLAMHMWRCTCGDAHAGVLLNFTFLDNTDSVCRIGFLFFW